MDWFIYAVAVLLVASVVLYIKVALFDKRPQKTGLLAILLAVPLYVVYYADRWPSVFGDITAREAIKALDTLQGAKTDFVSDIAPAFMVAGLMLIQMTVFQRVGVKERMQRVGDPIANFFGVSTSATLIGGIIVSTFQLGWPGAVIVGVVYALVYLGVLALLASIIQIFVELGKLIMVWLKRRVFAIATWITRVASFVSSLSGRLGLTTLAERIRAETGSQEERFKVEEELQDRELYAAFVRDRARQRRLAGKPPQDLDTLDEAGLREASSDKPRQGKSNDIGNDMAPETT